MSDIASFACLHSTAEEAAAQHEEDELEIQQGQQLDNLMREEQFAAAFKLALKLKRVGSGWQHHRTGYGKGVLPLTP